MFWFGTAKSNEGLVKALVSQGILKSAAVIEAMKNTDRAKFCRSTQFAYDDCPQPIGSNATISAPHMVRKNY
jgi:protein-L-isoaspartate(D-aspartate) O-methyltransferase